MRTASILACLLTMTACGGGIAGPRQPLDRSFELSVGTIAGIAGTPLAIEFIGVTGDSRCPVDAVCIQGGDAIVHIRVTAGSSATYELHTGDTSRASVVHGAYRISLVDLQPYPFSAHPISPSEYRVTLMVARAGS